MKRQERRADFWNAHAQPMERLLKILVPLKRVPDPDTKIRIKPDGSGIDLDGVKFAVNPFDAIALEEALRFGEKLGEIEIVVVSIGGDECVEQLCAGLAMCDY